MLVAQAEPSHTMSLACPLSKPFHRPLPMTEHLSLSSRRKITLELGLGGEKPTQVRTK